MPVYKITDKHAGIDVMVEAQRPNTAISALVAERFVASDALSASDALRLAAQGVKFLQGGAEEPEEEPERDEAAAGGTTRMPLSAFSIGPAPTASSGDEDERPEFTEVDEQEQIDE